MSAHTWFNANLVRLHKAVLCANCEVISEALNGHCAACGSEALLGLSRVLGGNLQSDDPQLHSSARCRACPHAPSISRRLPEIEWELVVRNALCKAPFGP